MRAHYIRIHRTFRQPVEEVFALLSNHDELNVVFAPMRVKRIRDGEGHRDGVGSTRKLTPPGGLPVEETIVEFVPNELIVYRITKGSPLKGHYGRMVFSPTPEGGTQLDYEIRVASAIPGVAPALKAILGSGIQRGLTKVFPA